MGRCSVDDLNAPPGVQFRWADGGRTMSRWVSATSYGW